MTEAQIDGLVLILLEESYNRTRSQLTGQNPSIFLDRLYGQILEDLEYEVLIRALPRKDSRLSSLDDFLQVGRGEIEHENTGHLAYLTFETVPTAELVKGKKRFVDVFIPTRNSGNRISDNVSALLQDLAKMPDDTGYKLRFCLNDADNSTVAALAGFVNARSDIPLQVVQITSEPEERSKKVPTNLTYFLLMDEHELIRRINPHLKRYIHFHDDDITINQLEGSGIFSNITQIEGSDILKLTSGIYSTSTRRDGFGFVNSARKNCEVLKKVKEPPIQIYGGAATMAFEAFPREGIPKRVGGFDCFMSTYLLMGHLPLDEGGFDTDKLSSRSNLNLFVEHPEEQSFYRFMMRLIRDYEYRDSIMRYYASKETEIFFALRKRHFESVRQVMMTLTDDNPLKIGFLLHSNIRNRVRELYLQHRLDLSLLRAMQPDMGSDDNIKLEYHKRLAE